MDKLERIFHIHKMLSSNKAPTRIQLMEITQSSRSTFNRDHDYLRDYLCAPVIYCAKRKGYIYDPSQPTFELPGLWMSPGELHALLACEQLLESVQPGLLTAQLNPLKKRVRKMLSHSGFKYKAVSDRIRVLGANTTRHTEPDRFAIIAEATLRERQLLIDYNPRSNVFPSKKSTDRLIEPQRLIHYRNTWLLVGWCTQRQALRYFSVDRITQPRIGEPYQQKISVRELDLFTHASFGIFSGVATNWAVLQFDPEPARWVADEHWHPEQIAQWLPDGKYELQIPYSDDRELVMEILKYGAGVEVIAPTELREGIKSILSTAMKNYQPI